jgi:hypothetical protein
MNKLLTLLVGFLLCSYSSFSQYYYIPDFIGSQRGYPNAFLLPEGATYHHGMF